MHTTNIEQNYPADVRLISTMNLDGVITYANPEFCEVAGYSIDELVGMNHSVVRHPDMPAAAFGDLWKHAKNDQPWMWLVKNRCKNGDYYWVQAYVTPLFNGAMLNITDRSTQVAAASEQQSAVAEEVNSNIEPIGSVASENNDISQKIQHSSKELSVLVTDLRSMLQAI
ncbi:MULTISPECIES: PAS domain-containing protein [unclassified Neptuniibacter]|uniref:PAS domain-containing protein n=1 Tax=unclassified Neptuniibacter TaxID=2630693 RepID=UPI000C63D941|nr:MULTISPECIES: PAS domain-containing protein [unclassified Neptuniibacter]MAY41017.1 hypothetical protein [Oceanospirillaceae bacterium]|tara:strand:- start:6383 stop:6892 length:510 start_codon:yes stop_codon:yes gene_type:complete